MAIPDYQTIMLPLLKLVKKHGDITLSKAITIIADQFNLGAVPLERHGTKNYDFMINRLS